VTEIVDAIDADRALKARHRGMWALGDYPAVATEVIAPLGPVLVEALALRPGERVVDVAAGSGNASLPAARAGARVVATDLTPELLEAGRAAAEAAGLTIKWREADAEAMPCDDGEHDVAMSCVGVMFAPHHELAAAELLRIVRPGGRIGLVAWTPEGFIGQMFATMRPYVPAPPPGVQPPPLWGSEDHVRALLGAGVTDLRMERRTLPVPRFGTGRDFLDFFKRAYGPTIVAYRGLDPDRAAALDRDLLALADRFADRGWEYLLVTATRG
jgi:SAM-dependent methyltransferase